MFDPDRPYKLHWELTDLCNLRCPMCPRTDILDHCRPVRGLRRTQFFLEDVRRHLPDAFLKKVKRIDFCGNLGDPCMARDFDAICRHLMEVHGITLTVSTNGSMGIPSWWRGLGGLFAGTESRVEFHLDGLKDTNHLYRIGARWDRIMANTEAFIGRGGRAEWHYIVFKHNQHQVEEARKMARTMGFDRFVRIETGRFPQDGTFRYMHPDGDLRCLERATTPAAQGPGDRETGASFPADGRNAGPGATRSHPATHGIPSESGEQSRAVAVNGVTCKSSVQNRSYIDAAGYVAPCCWVSHLDAQAPGNMLKALTLAGKDPQAYNIRNRDVEEILSDDLFSETFPDLWKSDSLETCRKKCGRRHRNIKSAIALAG